MQSRDGARPRISLQGPAKVRTIAEMLRAEHGNDPRIAPNGRMPGSTGLPTGVAAPCVRGAGAGFGLAADVMRCELEVPADAAEEG
jgi:hypothetical protein